MADIDYHLLAQARSAPSLSDLVMIYPLAGFSPPGTPAVDADPRASLNPPQPTPLSFIRDALNVETAFTGLTDTPASIGSNGQYLGVAGGVLAFVNPPSGGDIVSLLTALTGNARLPATAVRDLPAGGGGSNTLLGLSDTPDALGSTGQYLGVSGGVLQFLDLPNAPDGGIQAVSSDATLSGLGTSSSPLAVTNPFTAADKAKLDGIAVGAEVNVQADWNATSGDAVILNKPTIPAAVTAVGTRNLLETLTGNERLPVTAIRGLVQGVSAFTQLSDTPSALGTAGQVVRVNSAGDGLEFGAATSSSFAGLTDTPSSLGTAGQVPAVNSAGDALEFVDASFAGLTDTPSSLGTAGQVPAVNSAGDALEFITAGAQLIYSAPNGLSLTGGRYSTITPQYRAGLHAVRLTIDNSPLHVLCHVRAGVGVVNDSYFQFGTVLFRLSLTPTDVPGGLAVTDTNNPFQVRLEVAANTGTAINARLRQIWRL